MSFWGQMMLQDSVTGIMTSIVWLHDLLLMAMTLIIVSVSYFMGCLFFNKLSCRKYMHAGWVGVFWTLAPLVILLLLAFPSFQILYMMDEVKSPHMTLKAVGHQWLWSYEYSDFGDVSFDSYMVPTSDLKMGEYRLLETDHRACLPINLEIRLIVSSSDVIHSLAVPSLGVKVDGIPGRLNQVMLMPKRVGVYYGMCSEICGANHAFMPICIEVIPVWEFLDWVGSQLEDQSAPFSSILRGLGMC